MNVGAGLKPAPTGLCYTVGVMQTEAQLVVHAQAGSQEAFCELVERYKGKAMSIALGLLGNVEEAKDASQEAFVKAYRALPGFRAEASFATWFYRILVNECYSALRRRARAQRWLWFPKADTDSRTDVVDVLELVPSTTPSAQEMANATEVARVLWRAVQRLSPRQRSAITLRYWQGLSVEETGQVLGCATGTVKAQLARAMRHLRTQLDGRVEA